jgi:exosortase
MKVPVAHSESVPLTTSSSAVWPFATTVLVLAILWVEVIKQLKNEWSVNPQYGYGWVVPFVALFLLWKLWSDRPPAMPPTSRFLPVILICAGALLLFPIRFVSEANPDWRLLSWGAALIAVAISLAITFLMGGLPWLRHFAFPFLFFLVAVPWPTQFEQFVVQNLMRIVTAINVFVLNISGIPALQRGNVIEVRSGLIGIEEACSGVRSLQATLMISLFLGALYAFSTARRIWLVVLGLLLAFACNLVRTAILVWVGANHGSSAIEAWHDPAGLSILLVCLFGLWLVSLAMRRHESPEVLPPDSESRGSPVRVSSPLLISIALWLLLVEGGVQAWYGMHQSPMANARWSVRWPSAEDTYRSVPIAPEAEGLLRYNDGGGASWNGPDGHQWMMYFFRWLPGQTAALSVKTHRPDICLPASGMTLISDSGIRSVNINGVNLPIRSYRFEDHNAPLHVFYCYWDARSFDEQTGAMEKEDWTPGGRVRAAVHGQRELGAQMLEVVVWGYEDDGDASAALHRQLTQIVAPG